MPSASPSTKDFHSLVAFIPPYLRKAYVAILFTFLFFLLLLIFHLGLPDRISPQESKFTRSSTDQCWARTELAKYGYLPALETPSAFSSRLSNYLDHHRRCMLAAANITVVFQTRSNVSYVRHGSGVQECHFLVFEGTSQGLGNKLQALVSAFAYAILTNRVFLTMDYQALILLCNPFSEAGWYASYHVGLMMKETSDMEASDLSLSPDQWQQKIDQKKSFIASLGVRYDDSVDKQNFFCEPQQVRLRQIRFVVLSSEQYFLPALYYVSSFRADLEVLFPDMAPFTHLGRYILQPNNMIWDRITRMHSMHFSRADAMIGVQVRTFTTEDKFAHSLVLDCLVNISRALPPPIPYARLSKLIGHHDLPEVIDKQKLEELQEVKRLIKNPKKRFLAVLVSSLHGHHSRFLKKVYSIGSSLDGTLVSVESYSSMGEEVHNDVMDQMAFTEIWLLALSDTLFTSYFSTFGYISSGLSGKKPFLMNIVPAIGKTEAEGFEYNTKPTCELAVSAEPCYHAPPRGRQCASEAGADDVPEYVEACQDNNKGVRVRSMS